MTRVIAYVDGFNLYFGLRSCRRRDLYWLNVQALARNLLKPGQHLVHTKYFTARIVRPEDKRLRQQAFLDALDTLTEFSAYFGHYLLVDRLCPQCGGRYQEPVEKMTDVSIAVEMLADAAEDRFDMALLISADSDLCPPAMKLRRLYPSKRVVAAFPPRRHSMALANAVHAHFTIGLANLRRSVFPDPVFRSDGYALARPSAWR